MCGVIQPKSIMKILLLFVIAFCCFFIPAHAQVKAPAPDSVSVNKPDSTAVNSAAVERDGSSFDKAIIILKKTEGAGEKAEYSWIRKNYPGARTRVQSLNFVKDKPYDIIHINTTDGKEVAVYFDISNFYGKL